MREETDLEGNRLRSSSYMTYHDEVDSRYIKSDLINKVDRNVIYGIFPNHRSDTHE